MPQIGTAAKILAATATSAAVTGGLVVAHERFFLKAQEPELRRSRTLLTAGQIAGVGAVGTLAGAAVTGGATRVGILAAGGAVVASALCAGAYAVATGDGRTADNPPFTRQLEWLINASPPPWRSIPR